MSTIGTESYVQLPPDSSGKKVRTVTQVDDFGNTVTSEVVMIGDKNTIPFTAGVTATKYYATGSIGSQTISIAKILHQSIKGQIGSALIRQIIIHDIASGSVGAEAISTSKTHQVAYGTIGSAMLGVSMITHQELTGQVGSAVNTQLTVNQVVVGSIGVVAHALALKPEIKRLTVYLLDHVLAVKSYRGKKKP